MRRDHDDRLRECLPVLHDLDTRTVIHVKQRVCGRGFYCMCRGRGANEGSETAAGVLVLLYHTETTIAGGALAGCFLFPKRLASAPLHPHNHVLRLALTGRRCFVHLKPGL